jgi:ribose transport system ATP-binding protein
VLEIREISKSYSGQVALDDVDLTIEAGQIVLLSGPNGAGKSTLAAILAGLERPDSGSVTVAGRRMRLGDPGEARANGIWLAPQRSSLVESLTGIENCLLLLEKSSQRPPRRKAFRRWVADQIQELSDLVGLDVDPSVRLVEVPHRSAHQLMLLATLLARPRVLILDESMAALPRPSIPRLLGYLQDLVAKGSAAIVISHAIDAVSDGCTRFVRLDHGRVLEADQNAPDRETLPMALSYRDHLESSSAKSSDELLIEISESTSKSNSRAEDREEEAKSHTLSVFRGEVVGIVGNQADSVAEVIAGRHKERTASGRVRLAGTVAFVPADYDRQAIFPNLSIIDNLCIGSRQPTESAHAIFEEWHSVLGLDARPTDQASSLSGGNRQKVAILRGLLSDPDVLVLEEPFYSLDTNSALAVESMIRQFAKRDRSVVVVCDDLPTLQRCCSRIVGSATARSSPPDR